MNDGDTHDNSGTKPGPGTTITSSSHPNGTGGNNEGINPNADHAHGSGMFVAPHAAKSKSKFLSNSLFNYKLFYLKKIRKLSLLS
jgi:hypothetical protein